MNRIIFSFFIALLAFFADSVAMAKVITVQKGDNFWKIAQRFNVSWQELQQLNKTRLVREGNYNLLYPGQILELPLEVKPSSKSYVFTEIAVKNVCVKCHNNQTRYLSRRRNVISKNRKLKQVKIGEEFKKSLIKSTAVIFDQASSSKSKNNSTVNKEDIIAENQIDKGIIRIKHAKQEGVYVTKPGDNLENLSQLWWGTSKYAGTIAKHNGMDENLRYISSGKVLFIPEDVGTIDVLETNLLAYGAKGVKGDKKVLKAIDVTAYPEEAKQAMKDKVLKEDPEDVVIEKGELVNCVSDYYGVICNPSGFRFLWKDAETRKAKTWKNIKIPGRNCKISIMEKGGDFNLRCEVDVSETKKAQNPLQSEQLSKSYSATELSLPIKATGIETAQKKSEELSLKDKEFPSLENIVSRKLVIPEESNFLENLSSYQDKSTPNPLLVNQFWSQSLQAQPLWSSEFISQTFLPHHINIDGIGQGNELLLLGIKDEKVITYSPGINIDKPREISYSPLHEVIERINFQKNEDKVFFNYTTKY